jgi:hypothetical protein
MAKPGRRATAVLATILALATAGNASAQSEPTIVLHVANYAGLPPAVLEQAGARVAGVYNAIGVRTVWVRGTETIRRFESGALHLSILLLPHDKLRSDGARRDLLGQSHLSSGRAYIFCDRIAAMHGLPTALSNPLSNPLADVIAHEVGHLVLQTGSHSPSGIMRARMLSPTLHLLAFNHAEARSIRATLMAAQ